MRFRAKFQAVGIIWFAIAGMWVFLWLVGLLAHHHSDIGSGLNAILFTILAWLHFFSLNYTYWELDADSLRQRRLWIKTEIRWQDVTRIVNSWSSFYDLKIEYHRRGFGSKNGRILASPEDREQFIDALRRFAPHAEFVNESGSRILPIPY